MPLNVQRKGGMMNSMRSLRIPGCLVVICSVLVGCRMCASPYDTAGPVLSHNKCPSCNQKARAGSIFSSAMRPERNGQELAADEAGVLAPSVPTPPRGYANDRPRRVGTPLSRSEIDPFVELGIPPENIISVTDRPLETEDTLASQDNQVDDQAVDRIAETPRKSAVQVASRSSSASSQTSGDDLGWTRMGARPVSLQR